MSDYQFYFVGIVIFFCLLFVFLIYQGLQIKRLTKNLNTISLQFNDEQSKQSENKLRRIQQIEQVEDCIRYRLDQLFIEKEIYCDKNLTLTAAAGMLQTNSSYLSAIINNRYKTNFRHFVNKHRVDRACLYLTNNESEKFTIDGIAEMVGFKPKSAFYSAFKEFTGRTPIEYQRTA